MYEAVPVELRRRPQWGRWRIEKDTKIPYRATEDRRASSSDPATWADYETALRSLTKRDAGLAWFFGDDDRLTGVDLDKCIADGVISEAARAILDQLRSYSEISPSGTGVKVWVKGKLPAALKVSNPEVGIVRIEIYSNRRFFAVTGRRLEEYPAEPQEAQEVLDMLVRKYGRDEQPPPPAAPMQGAQPTAASDWARRTLNTAITKVVTAAEGAKHDELLKAARLAGGLADHYSQQQIESALEAALRSHASIKDWRGAMKTIRDGMEYGQRAPLTPPTEPPALQWRDNRPFCAACGNEARPSKFHADGMYCDCQRPALVWRGVAAMPPAGQALADNWHETGSDERPIYVTGTTSPHGITTLTDSPPPPVVWFAPGFIREGLGLIVGQPNVGKTPLAVQMALAAAAGVPWLGTVAMEPAKVLYLGCEYSKQELYPLIMESAAAMGLKFGRDITDDNFCYKTQDDLLPDSPDAAIADLEFYVALGFKLIIIDTLTAFLPPEKFKQNVYRGDYKELQPYHRLALRHSIALIGVWHASKREADPKLMYNGSTGMWAVPSSRIAMYEDTEGRKRISSFPRLGDRTDFALTQEKTIKGRRWVVADAAPEPEMSPAQQTVYRWLRDNSDKANPRSATTIAEMIGQPVPTVKTSLTRLFDRNLIQVAGRGAYYVGKLETSETFGSSETFETFETTSQQEEDSKFQHYSQFETFEKASGSPEVAKFQKFQGFASFKVSSEQIAILGAILVRRTPQSEAHAVSLCVQWGFDLETIRSEVLRLYHEAESKQ